MNSAHEFASNPLETSHRVGWIAPAHGNFQDAHWDPTKLKKFNMFSKEYKETRKMSFSPCAEIALKFPYFSNFAQD